MTAPRYPTIAPGVQKELKDFDWYEKDTNRTRFLPSVLYWGTWSGQGATSLQLISQSRYISSSFVATVDFWGPLISGHPNSPKILYLPVFQHLLIPHGNTDKLHFYIPWRNHQQSILTQGLNSYIAFKRHVIQHVCSHWESTLPLYLCLVGNPYLPPTSTPRGECGPCQTEAPRRFSKTHEMSSHL